LILQQNLHLGSAIAVPPVLCRLYRPSGLVREKLSQVTIERSIPLVPTDENRWDEKVDLLFHGIAR
jgi:hypothetical protein